MLMDQIKEYGVEGGSGDTPPADPPAEVPKPDENLDDLGYEKVEEPKLDPIVKEDPPADPPKEEEIKDPATGYNEDAPKPPDEKPKEDPPADPPKTDDPPKDVELTNVEGLLPNELEGIKTFAKKHGVTQEVAQALVDLKQDEIKKLDDALEAGKVEQKANVERIKGEWHKELKDDPDFGGEKFASSIKKAEKVIEEYMPNLKKELTKHSRMLPPYVMRDLAKLAEHLYTNKPMVKGEPMVPGQNEAESTKDDALEFYV